MPSQPLLEFYPRKSYNGINRGFNKNWFNHRKWLEYSVLNDSVSRAGISMQIKKK
jgi:hypothetical protein